MIRGVIREFTTTATSRGAKPKGYESSDTKSKKTTYDSKETARISKRSAKDSAPKPVTTSTRRLRGGGTETVTTDQQYQVKKSAGASYGPNYTATLRQAQEYPFHRVNPAWASWERADAESKTADSAQKAAKTAWDTAKEKDLKRTEIPKGERVPTGGASGGFGKGKAAGKGKGKKGKKKD